MVLPMTPEECADAVALPIGRYGTTWMLAPETFGPGIAAGFSGLDFYFCGRAGAMGDVDPDVVVASIALLGPEATRSNWEAGREIMPPRQAAELFAEACAEHGRRTLPDDVDLAGLVELAGRVIAAADCSGLPLFAAWRTMPVPDDARGAAAHQLNVLREFRGGAHAAAVISHGLRPVEASLVLGGTRNAAFLGHLEPYPEVTDEMKVAREAAERSTTTIVAPAFAALSDAERERFVELVLAAVG
jgi:hypothetical protein